MGTRIDLLDEVRALLARSGFAVSERCTLRPISFDVVARRDGTLLVLKVLGNADALSERVAHELRILAQFLDAAPLVVAERSGGGDLNDGVVYQHRGIPVLTMGSLRDHLVHNSAPMAFASPGGLYVNLRREVLRQIRVQRALSLGSLAQIAGVSRRAIQMYEDGMNATIDAAIRLEEFLHERLVEPIDPFRWTNEEEESESDLPKIAASFGEFEQIILQMLRSVGFRVVPTQQSPFAALTQQPRQTILTGVERKDATDSDRARVLANVGAVTESDSMMVVGRETSKDNLQGTPIIQRRELERLRDPQELLNLLQERRRRVHVD